MAKPKDNASDAGKQYAEIWGETIHSNRHLRVFTIVLGVLAFMRDHRRGSPVFGRAAPSDRRSGG